MVLRWFKMVFVVILDVFGTCSERVKRSSKGTRMNRMKHPGFILQTGVGMLEL